MAEAQQRAAASLDFAGERSMRHDLNAIIKRIARESVQSTGAMDAFICRITGGKLRILASASGEINDALYPVELPVEPIKRGKLTVQYLDACPDAFIGFAGTKDSMVRFAAVAPIACDVPAYLIVVDRRRRTRLSVAQSYTLRAHAAHVSTALALSPTHAGVVERLGYRPDIERLRLLESVAVHARDAVIITEAEPVGMPGPRILYCNAAFTRATGYSAEEVMGKTPRILQGPQTDPATRAQLRRALDAWEPIEIELMNYRKDGTTFWVELSIVPVADDKGWFTHWVSVQRDISERKKAEELAVRVREAEGQNAALETEIVERKRIEAELVYTAFHDGLTQLHNRTYFIDRLKEVLDREGTASRQTCTILFLDLDRFKVVNDSLGHAQGDTLLRNVAWRLKECVRLQDTIARIGGDEFAILIENDDALATAVELAQRIHETMQTPLQLSHQSVFPSLSIGIARPTGLHGSPDDLIRDADIAMYEAKRSGYGGYAIFDPSMHDTAVARLALQTDLKIAVQQKEFHLAYQPIVDPTTNRISGFEALLRWAHPTLGPIAPETFIPVAEEIGLIRDIDRCVMQAACRQLKEWHVMLGQSTLRMSVNTSAAEFTDPGFVNDLTAVLALCNLPPECLELEITEGVFLHPSPQIAGIIAVIRQLGVRVALDDFGTGFSSLSYISRYPIDTIKIDKSFIDEICTGASTRAIVDLIMGLGRSLSLNIIAKDVEQQEQADELVRMGCKAVQGFLYSKPLLAPDATRMLRSSLQHSRTIMAPF